MAPMKQALWTLADAPWYEIRLTDLIMIAAVILAPWLAVHIQRRLDIAKEKRGRKVTISRTLMATRATAMSAERVAALNMIDIEFHGEPGSRSGGRSQADKAVVDAWREYRASLDFGDPNLPDVHVRINSSREKFVDLLYQMSRALGYTFDKVELRNGAYFPQGHGEMEEQQRQIRDSLAKILAGEAALPVTAVLPADALKLQKELQAALGGVLSGATPIRVRMMPGI
jgi:hypothetical protein